MVYVLLILVDLCAFAILTQLHHGLEWNGINHPIGWGIYITNFVFWIGIAHAGTLISAVLYLLRASFRTSICRASEAMTLIAIMIAGLFPIIHLGRAQNFTWLFPFPNERELWVNFQSPLIWDVFAVTVYFFVSFAFLYLGMVPDFAAIRDSAVGFRKKFYRLLALGFRGTNHQWLHYLRGYLIFAGVATPLVFSVHSIVSWDFAITIVPGWHTTIFAPYFVLGAIFSGCAMILTLIIPMRLIFPGFKNIMRIRDFENVSKIALFSSMIITYSYLVELFMAWYGGAEPELAVYRYRAFGAQRELFWFMIVCNSIIPLFLWIKKIRTNLFALFLIAILINIGMWIERLVIVLSSLAHGVLPFAWSEYRFEWAEMWITIGSLSLFLLLFLLFIKFFPSLAIAEIKATMNPPTRRAP